MRRALLLGAAVLVAVAGTVAALVLPGGASGAGGDPHVLRSFIPNIKAYCLEQTGLPADSDIGYTFTDANALVTVDQDGSLTGIPAPRLTRLNICLAEYPIEVTPEVTTDHYTRNLLFDYDTSSLQPCLAGRTDHELPAMPSRADFVVRLYFWEPYRTLAPDLGLLELLELTSACPPLPAYVTYRADAADVTVMPHALAWRAQEDCFTAAGLATDPSQSWNIIGTEVNVYDAGGGVIATFDSRAAGAIAGRSLLNCLQSVPFAAVASPPANLVDRLLLADYTRHVLWPCLRDTGYDPGPVPDAAEFATVEGARDADPYASAHAGSLTTATLYALAAACPSIPRYLAAG